MLTLLIADDEPHIVSLVRATLEDDRIRVLEASDGLTALERARSERPDVLLLDLHMPGLDGIEVCRRLRSENQFAQAKIIMLTAAAQAADVARGLAAGADHYLTKPFSPIHLLTVVQAVLPGSVGWLPR
jgi:two-component system alkaline phosphatase synthesis response regulator PhoP